MDRAQFRDWFSRIDELTAEQCRKVAAVLSDPPESEASLAAIELGIVEADEPARRLPNRRQEAVAPAERRARRNPAARRSPADGLALGKRLRLRVPPLNTQRSFSRIMARTLAIETFVSSQAGTASALSNSLMDRLLGIYIE